MKRLKSKWIFIVLIPIAAYLGFYFHKPIVCFSIQKKLAQYEPHLKHAKVTYKKLLIRNKAIEIRDLRVKDPSGKKDAKDLVHIKKLKCHWMLQARPLKLRTFITIDRPKLHLPKFSKSARNKHLKLYKTLASFRGLRKVQIDKGSIDLAGPSDESMLHAKFTYVPSALPGEIGTLEVKLPEDSGVIKSLLVLKNQKAQLHINYQGLAAVELLKAIEFVYQDKDLDFCVTKGFFEGNMHLEVAKDNTLREFSSDLKAHNLSVSRVKSQLNFSTDFMHFETVLPKDKKLSLKKLPSAVLLKELVTSYEMGKGHLTYTNPVTKAWWSLLDITGRATFNHQTMPTLYFTANMQKDETAYPVTLAGKGWIDTEKSFWMDFDLTLHPEGQAGKNTSFYVALLDHGHYFGKASVSMLEKKQIALFQDLLIPTFPKLQNLALKSANLTCDLSLEIKDRKIESISLEHIDIKDLSAEFEEVAKISNLKKARGKFKLYFPLLDPKKPHSCDLSIEADEAYAKINGNPHRFTNLSLDLSSRDFQMQKGLVSASYQGFQTKLNFTGPFSMLDISAKVDFEDEHLLTPFQQKVQAVHPSIAKLKRADLEMKLKTQESKVHLITDNSFLFENELLDRLSLGVEFEKPKSFEDLLSLDKLRQSILRGWFKTEQMSEHGYLWILAPFKPKWFALGNMQAKGKFDSNHLSFVLRSEEALYDSEDLIVKLEKTNKCYEGNFQYDLDKDSWDILIPLEGAKCQDKRYQIPFYDVSGIVKIQGTNLSCEELKAKSEQVAFEGRLDLDFKNPSWLDLKLYPNKIDGSAQDFMRFLRYLPDFKGFDYPVEGRVKSRSENTLFTQYNQKDSVKSTKVQLELEEASFVVTDSFKLEDASCSILFDSEKDQLEIKELKAEAILEKVNEKRSYHLTSRELYSPAFLNGEWRFDLRFEGKTHDVLRLAGSTKKRENDFEVFFDKDATHFYGAKLFVKECIFDEDFSLKNIHVRSQFSSVDLFNQIQFLYLSGYLNMKPSVFEDLKNTKTEGDISLELSYNRDDQGVEIDIESRALLFDHLLIEDLSINACKNHHHFVLQKFKTKNFSAIAVAERQEVDWKIPVFEVHFKDSSFTTSLGSFKKETSTLHLNLEKLKVTLSQLIDVEEEKEFKLLEGALSGCGQISVDFSKGIKHAKATSELKIFSEDFTSAKCSLECRVPLKASFSLEEGVVFENVKLKVAQESDEHLVCLLDAKYFQVYPFTKTITGKSVQLTIPPEMILFLAKQNCFPAIGAQENQLTFFNKEFVWDNQIQTELDFTFEKGQLSIGGLLKEGYYWIGDKSIYLQNVRYIYENEKFNFACGIDYQNASLDIVTKLHLDEEIKATVCIKQGHEGDKNQKPGVQILCKYSKEDGFFVQNIEGEIFGLDFALQRNPRAYVPHVMILTGQIKIDTFSLVKAFPELFYQTFKELGMGSGYELSGDWVFSKKDLKSSHFKGFLKGRDFEFLGFYFKTLLSEVELSAKGVMVHDFSLSDKSGVCQIKEIKIQKEDESSEYQMHIPEITIQDFRPSFLKKNFGEEEQMKPFLIKDMHFFNIQGTIGKKDSFTGRGYLDFINTFKRDYNLLDIPIEIIGRIGFDLGLFIPVRGKLEFDMVDGKIFLKELVNTFSEGKRSRFYLSGHKDSYIDLDGTIFIDIKMKQYVLLKITEPFTLSIRGTLDKPKYSLK